MRRAEAADAACDLFSRSVPRWWSGRPPAFPLMAKRNGARLVIINRDATEFDDIADLVDPRTTSAACSHPSSRIDSPRTDSRSDSQSSAQDVHR